VAWGHGNAIVTWTQYHFGPTGTYIDTPIYASVTHDGGNTWTDPAPISGSYVDDQASLPTVAALAATPARELTHPEERLQRVSQEAPPLPAQSLRPPHQKLLLGRSLEIGPCGAPRTCGDDVRTALSSVPRLTPRRRPAALGDLPRGFILGAVRLDDMVPFAGDGWAAGPFCWRLEGARPFAEPVPCRGCLVLWPPPSPAALRRQLRAVGLTTGLSWPPGQERGGGVVAHLTRASR
jgi:hypothetical protein